MSQNYDKHGYYRLGLFKDGKKKTFFAHRLVAMAFIPNPYNYPEINHKNEIKTDNRVKNLEWCTKEYNLSYGTRIERVAKAKVKMKNIKCEETNTIYESAYQIEKECGFKKQVIYNCCNCAVESAYGLHWNYVD